MNEKKFRLPKEFGEKWLTALRSGDYEQGSGQLLVISEKTYCCLGVAGALCNVPNEILGSNGYLHQFSENEELPDYDKISFIPIEILESDKYSLPDILSNLNDGVSQYDYNSGKYTGFNFRPEKDIHKCFINDKTDNLYNNKFKLNFSEIADFIEGNCEFYEPKTN